MKKSLRRPRGFTLMELMVVSAVIGIIAAMSAVGMRQMVEFSRVNGNAGIVMQVLTNARTRAITTRCTHEVVLDLDALTPSLTVFKRTPCSTITAGPDLGTTPDPGDPSVLIPNQLQTTKVFIDSGSSLTYIYNGTALAPGVQLRFLFDSTGLMQVGTPGTFLVQGPSKQERLVVIKVSDNAELQ